MSRYLTFDEKLQIVNQWHQIREDFTPHEGDNLAGLGYPDLEIFALTDALNALPSICTLQSCAGHSSTETQGEYPGNLWIWATQSTALIIYAKLPQLAHLAYTEEVSILFGREREREVLSIDFQGLNISPEMLEVSSKNILEFFKSL